MKYAFVIHHEEGCAHGVIVPAIPGCFSAGDSLEEAMENVVEAIEGHLECLTENGGKVPRTRSIDDDFSNPEYAGGIWGVVDIDVTPYLGLSEKVNVTLPSSLVRRIDERCKNRSKFLADAAIKALA